LVVFKLCSAVFAVTVERILRQKITKGVRSQLLKRFDKDGDGIVSTKEFLDRVVANPMATLYAFVPGGSPLG
jgi:Ca2+-binding EF-hand superfamily protein